MTRFANRATVAAVPSPIPPIDWAAIYAEHGRAMRAVAIAEIGGRNKEIFGRSADDIVGDVVASLMRTGRDPSQMDNPGAYLKVAVRNQIRTLKKRSRFEGPDDVEFNDFVGDNDIEAEVDRHMLAHAAATALDRLPERERYVLVENVMKCREAKEVGPELNVTPQRVCQLKNQALHRLRQLPAFTDLGPVDRSSPDPSTATGPHAKGTTS